MRFQSIAMLTMLRMKIQKLKIFIVGISVVLTACTAAPPREDRIASQLTASKITVREVVFIHGMFVTPNSWDQWLPMFEKAGYKVSAPAWPLHDVPMARTKDAAHRLAIGKLGLEEVLSHYREILKTKTVKPVLVGHSMGGLIAQKLLQEGLAQSAVAIDSVAPNGMLFFSWSFLKSQWPVLNPFKDVATPVILTREEFAYAFANQQSDEMISATFASQIITESRKVAKDTLTDAGVIDMTKPRGPLLIIAGEKDHIIPAAMNYKNFELYRNTPGYTEFRMFEGRDHWGIAGAGWEELAAATLAWIEARQAQ